MDFLLLKKPTIRLRKSFFNQLKHFEKLLEKQNRVLTEKWEIKQNQNNSFNYEEEIVLTNTYLNSMLVPDKTVINLGLICLDFSKWREEP